MQFIRRCRSTFSEWMAHGAHPQRARALLSRLLFKLFVCLIFVPGLLTLIGYIVESGVYIPSRRTNHHTKYFGIAAYIAAPLVLIRWFWRWPKHAGKVDFVIYALQTTAFFLTLTRTSLSGNDLYQSNSFIREQFKSEQFLNIKTEKDTWQWLGDVMDYVYNRDDDYTYFARRISGRVDLITAIRLRQNRVKSQNCSALYIRSGFPGADRCYPAFSKDTEDRSAYGDNLRFHYYNNTVNSTTGYPISMDAEVIGGDFGSYPLAGFWVWFSPPLNANSSRLLLDLVQQSNWIDEQTRAIGFDLGLCLLDFIDRPLWASLSFLIEVNKAGKFVPHQPQVDINYFTHFEGEIKPINNYDNYVSLLVQGANLNSLDYCQPVVVLRDVLQPMYIGYLPFVLYTLVWAVVQCTQDWRWYFKSTLNITELVWAAIVMSVIGLNLRSLRYVDCGSSVFNQTLFDDIPHLGTDANTTSALRYALRFEFIQLATVWTLTRRLLGIAIFFQVFNFLRFLVRLKALGVLVRTLRFAATELLSFSFSFLVLFAGFVVMFYHIYSIEANGFRTVTVAVSSLWLGMLGELELTPELWRGGAITVGLFIVFTFLSAFVLLTTIVSIISTAHEEARKYDAKILRASRKRTKADVLHDDDDEASTVFGQNGATVESEEEEEIIREGELISQAWSDWTRSVTRRRKGRKVGILNGNLRHSPIEGGHGDGFSCGSDRVATSATGSSENSLPANSIPPAVGGEGDGTPDAGHWTGIKPVAMATDSENTSIREHVVPTNSATSTV